jgi:quercetin dioxygenase-like cupin family protein
MTQSIDRSPGNREHQLLAEEHAVFQALGTDPDATSGWFREHLDSGCPTCRAEFARADQTVAALHHAAPPVAPPPSVRTRLFDRVREDIEGGTSDPAASAPASAPEAGDEAVQVWKRWSPVEGRGLRTVRSGETEWEPTSVEGIYVRALHIDEEKDTVTMLVRMAAGTTYPSHRHAGDEQCFVLDGDLHVGEIVLHSGDFQLAPEESEHGPQSTVGGCTLLIVSSRNDELLPTS